MVEYIIYSSGGEVGKRLKFNWRKWLDGFNLAGRGILLATREKRFWVGFVVAFLFFGTLMNLLAGGLSKFELMGAVGFGGAMKIIGDAFLGVFGINMIFAEWIPVFLIALLQGVLIGLIVLLWDKKRVKGEQETKRALARQRKTRLAMGEERAVNHQANQEKGYTKAGRMQDEKENTNSANVEKAGIITGLIALGAGCPTCGTTLLTPLLGALFSTGGLAAGEVVSGIVTAAAIVIAILSLKRIGEETYVIMVNEKYMKKRQKAEKEGV